MMTERQFDTSAVTINYAESGPSGPLLLLLHGVTSRWQTWQTAIPPLLMRWRVVAVDLRGHGRSGRVDDQYQLMEYVQDIQALLRHLGGEPAVLIGHSLGAMITIGLASEAPEAVRAIVLEDPPLGAFAGSPYGMRIENTRFIATRDLVAAGHSLAELTRILTEGTSGQAMLAARARAASLHQIDPGVLTPIIESRSIRDYDLGDRLSRITCPALLLQGNPELGGALSDPEARWADSLMAQSTLVTIPDIGHQIHGATGAHAGLFDRLVSDFLAAV
jgi:pimeloyl-ACP methyl ester carboxylesterase